jgi:hypothetical protein
MSSSFTRSLPINSTNLHHGDESGSGSRRRQETQRAGHKRESLRHHTQAVQTCVSSSSLRFEIEMDDPCGVQSSATTHLKPGHADIL